MKKPYFIFLVVAFAINLFLYFYPADIFQTESNGVLKESILKDLLNNNLLGSLTIKGWVMLFIASIGIPAIIAWRSTLTKYDRKTGKKKDSVYDKLK